jgi:small subunit ribosomal protein S12
MGSNPIFSVCAMPTYNQLLKFSRSKKKRTDRKKALSKCPQKKGYCLRVYKAAPKKPNSARRSVARVFLSNSKQVTVYIPGIGHALQKHSSVLIRGGRVPDLPGVKFKVIRNKFDCGPVKGRKSSRSRYGVKK